jgi:hypothetical protein
VAILVDLAFRPSELLPSLFVRPSTFHILIFSSETTGPIATKLWLNGPWVTPFQICVRDPPRDHACQVWYNFTRNIKILISLAVY